MHFSFPGFHHCKFCFHNNYKDIVVDDLCRATYSVVICIEDHKIMMLLFFVDSGLVSPH